MCISPLLPVVSAASLARWPSKYRSCNRDFFPLDSRLDSCSDGSRILSEPRDQKSRYGQQSFLRYFFRSSKSRRMVFSPAGYLRGLGWNGPGSSLQPNNVHARAKPITIPQKKTLSGVGKDRDTAYPWWEMVFATVATKVSGDKVRPFLVDFPLRSWLSCLCGCREIIIARRRESSHRDHRRKLGRFRRLRRQLRTDSTCLLWTQRRWSRRGDSCTVDFTREKRWVRVCRRRRSWWL